MPQNYNREYYLKNKDKFLEWQRKHRLLHKEKIHANRIQYESNPEVNKRINELKRKGRQKTENQIHLKEYRRRSEVKRKARERIKLKRLLTNDIYGKQYYQKRKLENPDKLREIWRRWKKNNPRSHCRDSFEVQMAMNRVRLRDNNTCQWYGCGLKHKATQIHVHHIFPRSEYPDLELVEQYMICYCIEHHAQFHAARGDIYSKLILPNYQERKIIDYE